MQCCLGCPVYLQKKCRHTSIHHILYRYKSTWIKQKERLWINHKMAHDLACSKFLLIFLNNCILFYDFTLFDAQAWSKAIIYFIKLWCKDILLLNNVNMKKIKLLCVLGNIQLWRIHRCTLGKLSKPAAGFGWIGTTLDNTLMTLDFSQVVMSAWTRCLWMKG